MPDNKLVANHYTHGGLVDAIERGVQRLGKTAETVDLVDLGQVDEFHIGGRVATESFLDQLNIDSHHRILDVGCGLGGASRWAASQYGCRVTGIDLTEEYVETGNILCSWLGLEDKVCLEIANATELPYDSGTFDRAYMLHVGMNISEKGTLARELYRVIRPGGRIGIYDVMKVSEGEVNFPVPWAAGPDGSFLATAPQYKAALKNAGFHIASERNRRDFALNFFSQMQSRADDAGAPPPLGLHILMGGTAALKIKNMIENISRNLLAPVEIIADKPGESLLRSK